MLDMYAGLAILNPSARIQIHQYAKSASELFKLMLSGGSGSLEDKVKFKERVRWVERTLFGRGTIIKKAEWENGSTTSPRISFIDKAKTNSTLSVYS